MIFLKINNLFYDSQYGFRPGHSTEYAAIELSDRIISAMDKNKIHINIYLDLSKAFDTLDHAILLDKLFHHWDSGKSAKINKQLLRKQTTICRISKYKVKHNANIYRCTTGVNFRATPISNLYK